MQQNLNEHLTIAKADEEDVEELDTLVNSAFRGDSSKQGWTTEADLLDGIRTDRESLKEMILKKDAVILKCVDEESKIIGCVFLEKLQNKMYLGMLTVSPALQDKGIGKLLLKTSEEYALEQQCDKMKITVITNRTELLNWYKRHGYVSTGHTKPFPNDPKFGIPKMPLEFFVMEKELKNQK